MTITLTTKSRWIDIYLSYNIYIFCRELRAYKILFLFKAYLITFFIKRFIQTNFKNQIENLFIK